MTVVEVVSTAAVDGLTIAELGELLDAGALSAEELVAETCRHLESIGGSLNTVATMTTERAFTSARSADRARARGERGVLLGIPYGIKDIIDVEGSATTCGTAAMASSIAERDAAVVERLEHAGASLVAKLALAELIGLAITDPTSSLFGPAYNPWDRSRWAGGSSGGSAAAVAAGLVPFALGSETAGSIGAPAAWCGVTGFRPSYGVVPCDGVAPLAPSLDKVGVLARSAADCATVFDVIAALPPFDLEAACASVSSMTVGHQAGDFDDDAPPAMRARHVAALAVIAKVANLIESPGLPPQFAYREMLDTIMQAEAWTSFGSLRSEDRTAQIGDDHARSFLEGQPIADDRYRAAVSEREALIGEIDTIFETVDVVVTTNFALPWPIPEIGVEWTPVPILGGNTAMVWASNLAGLPAVSIPVGLVDGLPISVQFVGPVGSDRRLMTLAHVVQKETAWHRLRPPMEAAT